MDKISRRGFLAASSLGTVAATAPGFELEQVEIAVCEESLRDYAKNAWRIVEPRPFIPSWHIDAVCDHLEAVTTGQIRNLIVNIPPRHTKSLLVSVLWPTWEWGPKNRPDTRWLCMSYAAGLSLRDALKSRKLIQSRWYQQKWGYRFRLSDDQNAKSRYNTDHNGFRVSSSVGGLGTGEGGERIVIDDPINLNDAESEAARKNVVDWWDLAMPTRLNDPKSSATVIIMQRSHHGDLVGHIKDRTGDLFEWLVLPAEFESKSRCVTSIGWKDPRVKECQLLCPERFDDESIKELKRKLGSYAYSAQFQQRPSPVEGGIIKRSWCKYYKAVTNPDGFDAVLQSWDMAFKALNTSSYVVGLVWGVKGANFYLLDRVREHLTFTETITAVKNLTEKWPESRFKFIEEKANGAAVIDTLKSSVSGLIPCNPKDSKEGRAFAVSPDFEAGNIWLPHPHLAPWVESYLEQLAQFPKGAYSDDMDATSQAILEMRKRVNVLVQHLPPVVSGSRTVPWASMR